MRDTYADARERAQNRGRMTCAEQEAPNRALRGKRTGSRRLVVGLIFPGDEYMKEQEESGGKMESRYKSPLRDVDHVPDEFERTKGIVAGRELSRLWVFIE